MSYAGKFDNDNPQRGDVLTAADVRNLIENAERAMQLTAESPLRLSISQAGMNLTIDGTVDDACGEGFTGTKVEYRYQCIGGVGYVFGTDVVQCNGRDISRGTETLRYTAGCCACSQSGSGGCTCPGPYCVTFNQSYAGGYPTSVNISKSASSCSFVGGMSGNPGTNSVFLYLSSNLDTWQLVGDSVYGGSFFNTYYGSYSYNDCSSTKVLTNSDGATVTITLGACSGGSGSGSGSGSPGGSCYSGACAEPGIAATLTGTVTNKTGCFTAQSGAVTWNCANDGLGYHRWDLATGSFACLTGGGNISAATGAPKLSIGGGFPAATADPGYTCVPFSAVFRITDGAGNSCTVTVSG